DNSLCILCGRCVRICEEVRGACVLTFVGRGSESVVGTAMDRRLLDSGCQYCGACVDVCPTGSLSERAVRYERLPETELAAICAFCGQGCGLKVGTRGGRVIGAVPDREGAVNRGQACVRGRFLVKFAVDHPDRIRRPMIRRNGLLEETTWEEALATAAERLAAPGPGDFAAFSSGQISCEDLFVLHKFVDAALGPGRIDGPWAGSAAAELKEIFRAKGTAASLNFRIDDVGEAKTIVLIGEDVAVTQPIVGVAINQASRKGAEIVVLGPESGPSDLKLEVVKPALILFGPELLGARGGRSRLKRILDKAVAFGGRVIAMDRESNIRGGLEISAAFSSGTKPRRDPRALYIAGGYPKIERGAAEIVIVQGSYMDENASSADIVFPETTSFEADGTFINVEGRAQLSRQAAEPRAEARPGWAIVAGLAAKMGRAGFGYSSAADVREEIARTVPSLSGLAAGEFPAEGVFVAEKAAPEKPAAGHDAPVPRGVDDYKGLDMARTNKSLRLIRGR
ncbi:MAG: formate dehydrogenase subunit alpha, partial [Candidatus Aminicenantes bacterium]|nr:formate dehydrogenase subunit alpha [Candidatus Aminicenantes bacterium]